MTVIGLVSKIRIKYTEQSTCVQNVYLKYLHVVAVTPRVGVDRERVVEADVEIVADRVGDGPGQAARAIVSPVSKCERFQLNPVKKGDFSNVPSSFIGTWLDKIMQHSFIAGSHKTLASIH